METMSPPPNRPLAVPRAAGRALGRAERKGQGCTRGTAKRRALARRAWSPRGRRTQLAIRHLHVPCEHHVVLVGVRIVLEAPKRDAMQTSYSVTS